MDQGLDSAWSKFRRGEEHLESLKQLVLDWAKVKPYASQGLHAVSPPATAAIERLQPYHMGPNARDHPLWALQELDRIDKHRSIHVIGHFAPFVDVRVTPELDGTAIETFPGEIVHGAPVALITVARNPRLVLPIEVRCRVANGVAIGGTATTPPMHLGITTEAIRDATREVLETMAPFLA